MKKVFTVLAGCFLSIQFVHAQGAWRQVTDAKFSGFVSSKGVISLGDSIYFYDGRILRQALPDLSGWKDVRDRLGSYREAHVVSFLQINNAGILVLGDNPNYYSSATPKGLLRTIDYGNTWTFISFPSHLIGISQLIAIDTVLYGIAYDTTTDDRRIIRSDNKGESWTSLAKITFSGALYASKTGVILLYKPNNMTNDLLYSVDGSEIDTMPLNGLPSGSYPGYTTFVGNPSYYFASIYAYSGSVYSSYFYRFDVQNQEWTTLKKNNSNPADQMPADYTAGNIHYYNDVVYISLTDKADNQFYTLKSVDNGSSWQKYQLSGIEPYEQSNMNFTDAGDYTIAIAGSPFETKIIPGYSSEYYSTAKLYLSKDNMQTWMNCTSGITAVDCHNTAVFEDVIYTAFDYKGVLRSTDRGVTWNYFNPSGFSGITKGVKFLASEGGLFLRLGAVSDENAAFYRLLPGSSQWEPVVMPSYTTATSPRFHFLSAYGNSIWVVEYSGNSQTKYYRSEDHGSTWQDHTLIFQTNFSYLGGIKGKENALFAYGRNILRSLDNGLTWTSDTSGISFGQYDGISNMVFVNDKAFACFEREKLYTKSITDINWQPVYNPPIGFLGAAQIASNKNVLYYFNTDVNTGEKTGIHYSMDEANTWISLPIEPDSRIDHFNLLFSNTDMILATRNAGLYIYNGIISGINNIPHERAISIYPNPASDAVFILQNDKMTSLVYSIYDMAGKLIRSDITYPSMPVNITDVKAGTYIFVISDDKTVDRRLLTVVR